MPPIILLLGAGQEQCIAINQAKELGYKVVACDGSPNAPGLMIADIGIVVDIRNVEKLIKVGVEHQVNGIFCHAVEIPVI